MSTYLSTTDIFLAPTPEIRALHDKSILIVTPSGDQMLAKICVEEADPEGRDAGKCSVIVWTTSTDERGWVDAPSGRPPQLHPAALRLSAMISQYFIWWFATCSILNEIKFQNW